MYHEPPTKRERREVLKYTFGGVLGVWVVLWLLGITDAVHGWEDILVLSALLMIPVGVAVNSASEIWYVAGERAKENAKLKKNR